MKISPVSNNFKGIYLSNALAPGYQRDYAKRVREQIINDKFDLYYERMGEDILINPSPYDEAGIILDFVPYTASRVLDDNYSRWNGRLY